ncbi:CCA tRNA nucleotidyltransferase [Halobacillus sp. Nhm2S1]|uniref:CCA tRNA nucleotidyltransferase n=1 Tax=Halobacillus sp. Nhm2S1 TaxID=2866716 RepID=UPI001C72B471|nr:CCA tRNA nucleotidyltransferase [Halobacillus sp. Nhm2S1]MBX0356242.1 CCA tRNA nucleotidyltransferase [Halobacillus sp. Nhm2S1]
MSSHDVFKPAFEVIQKIEEAGGEAYIVGGAVRDYLSGRPVNDIDIATSETPERIQEIFEKVIPVGIEHGTVIVRHRSVSYEVTTYRVEEGYEDYRHPDEVTFVRDITLDLARRDFTTNAIAMSRDGRLIDPYHGHDAIRNKKIEAVGEPSERFHEDPLRMMRAVRFASQLSFKIEKRTEEALTHLSPLLQHISIERIAVEVEKIFGGSDYALGLQLLQSTGLKNHLPILKDLDIHRNVPYSPLFGWHEIIAFYALQYPHLSPENFMKSWKLSKDTKKKTEQLLHAYKTYERKKNVTSWLVYQLDDELFASFSRLFSALHEGNMNLDKDLTDRKEQLPIQNKKELSFQARDLLQLYTHLPKGPWISEWMDTIEHHVVTGEIENDYEKIKEWVRGWNPPASN